MIGALYEKDGTHFRVWAPGVEKAYVAYDGHWSAEDALPLERKGEYFEGFSPDIEAGTAYKFLFVNEGREMWRMDPAARDTAHSGDEGNVGYVVDPAFDWPAFRTPPFDDLRIYQLHVGSFAGRNDDFAGQLRNGVADFGMVEAKLDYIRDLGFNVVELLPIQEFQHDRSWGYNPSFYFSVESAYGSPDDMRRFVAAAHRQGLAVIFDVVYNHVANSDNPLWRWPAYPNDDAHGEYLYPPHKTDWGAGPAFQKPPVREFFIENALMLLEEYRGDGLRFDVTRAIESNGGGWQFLQELTWRVRERHPDRYLVAEHLPDHDSIVRDAGMSATWMATSHHEFQRAAQGNDPVRRVRGILGKSFDDGRGYPDSWNLVKYCLGSHDDCGDDKGGDTWKEGEDWKRHRYFVDFYGGRGNWHARAKARLGWALNVAAMGTPMLFMGLETHQGGWWHDDVEHGFDWALTADAYGREMRRLVASANAVRRSNPALRGETLDVVHEDHDNQVLAFKRYLPGGGNCVLAVVNLGDRDFTDHSYGVPTGGQPGRWTQILSTQDAAFGGWDGAGNAFHEPATQDDGRIYINLPQWSVVMMRLVE
jgi:1,4-alpha-glucan branching enzyme